MGDSHDYRTKAKENFNSEPAYSTVLCGGASYSSKLPRFPRIAIETPRSSQPSNARKTAFLNAKQVDKTISGPLSNLSSRRFSGVISDTMASGNAGGRSRTLHEMPLIATAS